MYVTVTKSLRVDEIYALDYFFGTGIGLNILSTVLRTHNINTINVLVKIQIFRKRSGESVWMAKLENSHPDQEEGEWAPLSK
jgi:hypothetical protein